MENNISGENHAINIHFLNSFQARLLLIIVAVTIIPMIILETISVFQNMNSIKSEVYHSFSRVAADEVQYLNNWKRERMGDIKTLAAMDDIQAMDPKKGEPILKKYQTLWGGFEGLSAVTPQGNTEISTSDQVVNISEREYFKEAFAGKEAISEPLI